MNRIVFTMDAQGFISGICADAPVEVFINCPHVPADRVYRYGSLQIGPEHVRAAIGGFAVGHLADGTADLVEGDGTGRNPPSKPNLKVVE